MRSSRRPAGRVLAAEVNKLLGREVATPRRSRSWFAQLAYGGTLNVIVTVIVVLMVWKPGL